jgi:hypothetical protein
MARRNRRNVCLEGWFRVWFRVVHRSNIRVSIKNYC